MKDILCEIRENGVCACFPKKCEEVDQDTCIALKCAFHYGVRITENKANENIKTIKEKLDEVFKTHGWDGENQC